MSDRPRTTSLPYASPRTDTADPSAPSQLSWRTAAVGIWLLVLIAAALLAIDRLTGDQSTVANIVSNVLTGGGGQWGGWLFDWFIVTAWTFGIGVGASLLLWHWSRLRMVWLATLPLLALGWNCAAMVVEYQSPPLSYAAGLMVMTIYQSAALWAGGFCGRSLLVIMANILLPPSFAAELRLLWSS